jgi:predicted PurR-regulated permease PerM
MEPPYHNWFERLCLRLPRTLAVALVLLTITAFVALIFLVKYLIGAPDGENWWSDY